MYHNLKLIKTKIILPDIYLTFSSDFSLFWNIFIIFFQTFSWLVGERGEVVFYQVFQVFPDLKEPGITFYFIFLSQHSSAQQTNNQNIGLMVSLNWFKVPKILRFSTKEPCNNTFKYHKRPSYYLCHKKYTFPLKTLCEIYINQRTYLS